ncbi:MAG TPA: hypothetical protein VGP08_25665 [Pyrinomonadaceae bacterium]|jgi:predicted chitinase/heme/copper-type cytochrome/quinol oxidase subunit 4|nr:hypothetical protein [Pyrinomonadaceae bacterium]
MTLTDEMLRKIMPNCPTAKRQKYLPYLIAAMVKFEITNYRRAAAFLATIAVESGELKYFEEIASGARYENRPDLGNVRPGDGKKYKGRGVIQVTGRTNSEKCLNYLKLPAGRPELLAELEHAFMSAGWFWDQYKGLNALADAGTDTQRFLRIQKRVNGYNKQTGLPNGWSERLAYFQRALKVLPQDLKVTPDVGVVVAAAAGGIVSAASHVVAAQPGGANGDGLAATPHAPLQASGGIDPHEDDDFVRADSDDFVDDDDAAARDVFANFPTADVAGAGFVGAASVAAAATPVIGGGPDDPSVKVDAAAPAKERSKKSLISTLTAGLGSIGLTISALATRVADWIQQNPALVVLFALAIVAIIVCYLLYQHRQTKLDLADRQHAKDVTLETMRIRSDPRLINVEVVPRAVPAEAPKG